MPLLPIFTACRDSAAIASPRKPGHTSLMRTLLSALLLTSAVPIAAQPAADSPAIEAVLQSGVALMNDGKASEALIMLDAALAAAVLPAERGRIQQLRAFILAGLERIPEARAAMEFAIASNPDPTPALLSMLFKLRAFTDDPVAAAETLVLLTVSDPAGLALIPTELIGRVRAGLAKDEPRGFDLDFALVGAGWLANTPEAATLDVIRQSVIKGLLARERADEAATMLAAVRDPEILIRMGIDRRFLTLWPAIEARLGPGAATASNAAVARAKEDFDKTPDELAARRAYAQALNLAAREEEALAIASGGATQGAALDKLGDEDLWLVDLEARLLAHIGRYDAALARYDQLAGSALEGRPGLIGPIIARAMFANELGRPDAALAAADFAEQHAELASASGRLYIAAARACALVTLGDAIAAQGAASPVLSAPDDNPQATLSTLMCLGQTDAAAATVRAALDDPARRGAMLWQLQPFLIADRGGATDNRMRAGMRALKARPDVSAAFRAVGRDLPAKVSPPR